MGDHQQDPMTSSLNNCSEGGQKQTWLNDESTPIVRELDSSIASSGSQSSDSFTAKQLVSKVSNLVYKPVQEECK
jgi:hypothetical protein